MKTRRTVVQVLVDYDGLKGRWLRVVSRTKTHVEVTTDDERRICFTRSEVSAQKTQ